MGDVRLTVDGGVATLTLDSPEVKNALSMEMAQQIVELCADIDRDPSIGAAVVQGANGTFCSGADTRVLLAADPAPPSPLRNVGYDAFVRFGNLAVPTVAAVQGAAVGAGLNLALAADLRIVARNARLIAGFQRIGIHPGGGFFTIAGRSGGREVAAALGVFGEEASGERAVELGMAWEAVEPDAVVERAQQLASRVAKDPELARVTIRSFRVELGPPPMTWPAAVELERSLQDWSRQRLHTRS